MSLDPSHSYPPHPYESMLAYLTPGWTAQNFAYPPQVLLAPPPLPAGLMVAALTHTYLRSDGSAQGGNVRVRRYGATEVDGVSVGPYDKRVNLVNGALLILVLAEEGQKWRYEVHEAFPGGLRYPIEVPAVASIDIRAARTDNEHPTLEEPAPIQPQGASD